MKFEDALGALIAAHAGEGIARLLEALDDYTLRLELARDEGLDVLPSSSPKPLSSASDALTLPASLRELETKSAEPAASAP